MPVYVPRDFVLTMDGGDMALTLKGIYSPKLILKADPNNLFPIYLGTIYENGNGGTILPLGVNNNMETLIPGEQQIYGDMRQYDRFPRTRNFYIENNYLHMMPHWFVKGTIGDILFVSWLDENTGSFRDIHSQQLIDVTSAGLSR